MEKTLAMHSSHKHNSPVFESFLCRTAGFGPKNVMLLVMFRFFVKFYLVCGSTYGII